MTPLRRAVARLVLATLLGSCSAAPAGPDVPTGEFTLLDADAWPGGMFRVQSPDFADRGDGGQVELAGMVMPLVRVDGTTLAAMVPADAVAATGSPTIRFDGYEFTLPPVTIAGYASSADLAAAAHIAWDTYVAPIGGTSNAIGGNLDGDLAMVDMQGGTVRTVPGALDWNRLRGPGMTYQPGTWILRGSGGLESWQLGLQSTKVADHPEFTPGFTRQAAQLAPDAWLVTTSQAWQLYTRPDALTSYQATTQGGGQDPQGIVLSPRGDRAVMRVDRYPSGIAVIDVTHQGVAFLVQLTSILGAAFSGDGAQLAVAGDTGNHFPGTSAGFPSRVQLLSADDGAVLASRDLDDEAFAVAFDPSAPRVLVGISRRVGGVARPAIVVLNRADLAPIATLEAPEAAATCGTIGNCFGGALAITAHAAHVFWSWNGPPHLWHFELLVP